MEGGLEILQIVYCNYFGVVFLLHRLRWYLLFFSEEIGHIGMIRKLGGETGMQCVMIFRHMSTAWSNNSSRCYTFLVQFLWGYTNLLEYSNVFLYESVTFTDAY